MSARQTALFTLIACERKGAWAEGHLKKSIRSAGLDRRDAALATRLCFGVLQNKMLLDYYISCFSHMKPEKMEYAIRNILRLGVYQMAFLTKIPHSAAVSESVELAKSQSKNPRAPGMVNGILRNISRSIDKLPPIKADGAADRLSLRYSHPRWLTEKFILLLGHEGAEALLRANNAQVDTTAQVNLCKTDVPALIHSLRENGVTAESHPWLEGCVTLAGFGNLEELPAFREGLFFIQDAGARLCVSAMGLLPGMRVMDACAAPGGKSFSAAIDMGDDGEILASDIYPHKKRLIESGIRRLGFTSIETAVQDAAEYNEKWDSQFDAVIADVPCSGLGVIRKKPEIRYKPPEALKTLPELQKRILSNTARYVKPGGVLLYSTCTLLKQENEDVVMDFLSSNPAYSAEPFALPGPAGSADGGMITLWPHLHGTDGFFIAKLRRCL